MTDRTPGPDATRPHGTRAAIRRHERAGEPMCEACRVERNRLAKEMYRKRTNAEGRQNAND